MKIKLKKFFKGVCFFLLLSIIFIRASEILERKAINGPWNSTIKIGGFQNEPKNSLDVIAVGSSHMYCTLVPNYLYENYGIKSYVLSSQQQPIGASYHFILEALRTQKPKTVIVETLMVNNDNNYTTASIAHDAIDYLPLSLNKIRLINDIVPKENRPEYYFNIIKYHTRWSELTASDFSTKYRNQTDELKGYVKLEESIPITLKEFSYVNEKNISAENIEYLNKIVELSKEHNFKLIFLASPFQLTEENSQLNAAIASYANEKNVTFIDMNKKYDELDLNAKIDFYDTGHLNYSGAQKATKYIGDFLKDNN